MDHSSLKGTSNGTGGVAAVVDTIRKLKKEDANSNRQDHISRLTAEDNSSVPFELPPTEEASLVEQMREAARLNQNHLVAEADTFWLVATLRARKGDVKRAVALASSYLEWRVKVDYENHTPASSDVLKDIMEAGLFIPAGNESRDGRPVLTVRYRFFDPRRYSALNTARAFGFIVEWMLRTHPKAQTHGIVVVEDVAGFSLKNFDLRLISFLEKAFSPILPVRISALHIANPGWFIKALFGLFEAFFSDKLKARIRLFGKGDEERFAEFFDKDQNLVSLNLGGALEWTPNQQEELTTRLLNDSLAWAPASSFKPDA